MLHITSCNETLGRFSELQISWGAFRASVHHQAFLQRLPGTGSPLHTACTPLQNRAGSAGAHRLAHFSIRLRCRTSIHLHGALERPQAPRMRHADVSNTSLQKSIANCSTHGDRGVSRWQSGNHSILLNLARTIGSASTRAGPAIL